MAAKTHPAHRIEPGGRNPLKLSLILLAAAISRFPNMRLARLGISQAIERKTPERQVSGSELRPLHSVLGGKIEQVTVRHAL